MLFLINWLVPIILVGILLIITAVLILADRLLGSSGDKIITVNNEKEIRVQGEDTALNILAKNKIFIPSACGGKATCGFCKFKVLEGDDHIKPTEEPFLSEQEKKDGIRLSCQIKVKQDLKVEIPKELLYAQEYITKVARIEDLTYDIKLIELKLVSPDKMEFRAGQYAQIKVPGIEVIRAYSIASNPRETTSIEFIVRMVPKGQATTFVHKALEYGDKVIVTGPYGTFFLQEDSNREIVCIAGGSGKAPIRSILFYLKDQGMPRKVRYFFGARSKRDLYYTDEFLALEKEFDNFEYIPALSDPEPDDNWEGETGLITDVLDRHVGDMKDMEAYLCGSPGMIDACIKVLSKHDCKDKNIYYDKFS